MSTPSDTMAALNKRSFSDQAGRLRVSDSGKPLLWLPVFALLVLSTAVGNAARADVGMALQALNGEHVNLGRYVGNGKWLLVMLWATDCAICVREKPAMSAFHDKHRSEDAQVLGIALDGYDRIGEINRFLASYKPSFPTLVGDIASVAADYQSLTGERLRGTPTYLLFSPAGELLGNNPGPVRPAALEAFMLRHTK